MKHLRVLTRAKEKVLEGWSQGALARDKNGKKVNVHSPDATHWSVVGAVLAAAYTRDPGLETELWGLLMDSAYDEEATEQMVTEANDDVEGFDSVDQVERWLNRAIERAKRFERGDDIHAE